MAAGQQSQQDALDHILLADDALAYLLGNRLGELETRSAHDRVEAQLVVLGALLLLLHRNVVGHPDSQPPLNG